MRRPPPPHVKGTPKTPGSGRKRGTPNRKTVELRQLMGALAGDVAYQHKLRQAFVKRRLHPTTEMRVWEYVVGKPKEQIEMSAKLSMDARLAAEREIFSQLDVERLEELAAESQALVDRALAMVEAQRAPGGAVLPGVVVKANTINDAQIELVNTQVGTDDVRAATPPSRSDLPTSTDAAAAPRGVERADSADSSDEPGANHSGIEAGDRD